MYFVGWILQQNEPSMRPTIRSPRGLQTGVPRSQGYGGDPKRRRLFPFSERQDANCRRTAAAGQDEAKARHDTTSRSFCGSQAGTEGEGPRVSAEVVRDGGVTAGRTGRVLREGGETDLNAETGK